MIQFLCGVFGEPAAGPKTAEAKRRGTGWIFAGVPILLV